MTIETPVVQVFNTILITGVIYGFIFNGFIFLSKKRKGKPLFFLSLIVLFISLNNLQAWLIDMGYSSSIVYIKQFRVPWYFFCMPLFYVFLVHYLKIHQKVKSFLYITISIFMVMILLRFFLIIYTQINDFDELDTKLFISIYSSYEEIISFLYTLFIFIYAILMLTKNKKWFEYILKYDDLKWIKHFLNLGVVIIIIWLIAIYRNSLDGSFSSPRIYYPLRLSTSILIYWVGFKGLFRYRVLEDRIVLRENINKERVLENSNDLSFTNGGYGNEEFQTIKSEKQQIIFDKINSYVNEHKKYLDPSLSLESLAKDLKISNGHLSFLINTFSKKHFTDYINEYRINQVKKILLDKDYVNYTIESIGLESGFNSKSTFYSAFKKYTELSPIQFKKQFYS